MMNPSIRRLDVALGNGVTLPVAEHGDPRGTPLLLLHGNTDSWRSWEPVLPLLPRDIRALAVTMRGHGDASKPATGYAPSDFAADAAALLDRLGIDRAFVCGHSFGSFVAQRFALDHPGRVAGLILEASFPTMQGNPVIEDFWTNGVAPLGETLDRSFTYGFQAACVSLSLESGIVDIAADESLKTPALVLKESLRAAMEVDHRPELRRVGVPTLLLWGAQDAFFGRADQEALLGGIPDARLSVFEESGHSVHWDEPRRFAREVAGFVAAVRRRHLQPA